MPVFRFLCPQDHEVKKLLKNKREDPGVCPECGGQLKRSPTGPSSTKMETLDNGAMRRKLERPADVERMNSERAAKHSRENRENR